VKMRFVSVLALFAVALGVAALDIPDWKQCDPTWGDFKLGNSSQTLCKYGWTETCYAMLMASRGYAGTPGTLVKWLNKNDGYICFDNRASSRVCLLNHLKIDKLNYTKYYSTVDNVSYGQICSYIDKGWGVIAYIKKCDDGHNVLLTGFYGYESYSVHDPTGCVDKNGINHHEAFQFMVLQ